MCLLPLLEKGETEKTKLSLSSTKEKLSPQRFLAVRNKGQKLCRNAFANQRKTERVKGANDLLETFDSLLTASIIIQPMGIARGWEKQVIRTNITYAKRTVSIFSLSPSLALLQVSVSLQTFCLIVRKNLITQKYGLFCSLYALRACEARSARLRLLRYPYPTLNRF